MLAIAGRLIGDWSTRPRPNRCGAAAAAAVSNPARGFGGPALDRGYETQKKDRGEAVLLLAMRRGRRHRGACRQAAVAEPGWRG